MEARDSARRRRTPFAVLGAFALSLSVVALAPQATAAPDDADLAGLSESQLAEQEQQATGIPGVDEIRNSRNVKHLANLPKPAPFTSSSTWSDLAFQNGYAFDGNYDGFVIYDVRNPHKPSIVSTVWCPGSQNDISVKDNLLFLSTDSSRSDNSCASTPLPATNKDAWEGIKIFDISDKKNPKYVAAVETKCGSHTHTLVPDKKGKNAYLYVSSYAPSAAFPDCQPPHDLISIVKVPLKNPAAATLLSEPVLFPDGGNPGRDGTIEDGYVRATSGCHDITVYPSKDLAAGACMGDGVLWDISDREQRTSATRASHATSRATRWRPSSRPRTSCSSRDRERSPPREHERDHGMVIAFIRLISSVWDAITSLAISPTRTSDPLDSTSTAIRNAPSWWAIISWR